MNSHRAALTSLSLASLILACEAAPPTDDAGVLYGEDAPVSDTPTTCGDLGDEPCNACLSRECCDAARACAGDLQCLACLDGDADACESSEETHVRVDAALTCRGGVCAESCLPPTEGPDCTMVFTGSCGTCLADACCAEVSRCAANANCLACVGGDHNACHAEADGHALAHALWACSDTACVAPCGG